MSSANTSTIGKLTVGSLFAGIGGIELGLEWTGGFETVWQVENDEYATRILQKHWPEARRWEDVRTFPPDADRVRFNTGETKQPLQRDRQCGQTSPWHVDLITAGFPCQDISYAGKGAGLGGERSGLFHEAARVIRTLGPRYVLLENVGALLTRGIDTVLGTLASLGYDAEWHCIPAAAVGAPHIRDRVFILSYAIGEGRDSSQTEKRQRQRVNFDSIRRTQSVSWWATEPDVGRVADGVSARVDRLRCLGNAVVPQVAEFVGYRILEMERGRCI